MKLFKNVDFMAFRKQLGFISLLLVIASVGLLLTKGLNLGLDFTGSTVIEVHSQNDILVEDARDALNGTTFADAVIQHFGSARDVVVRVAPQQAEQAAMKADEVGLALFARLQESMPDLELRRVEFVGPQVGDELRDQSGTAMLVALIMIFLYVWFRFTNKFGFSAVAALFHDVLIVLGAFSLFSWQVDLTVLAALLALIGYSINDSIVIADYVRDTFRTSRKSDPEEVVNDAVHKTLGRTVNTAITTAAVVLALLLFGGEAVFGFAQALFIGVIVGTYSSIYIVCNIALSMNLNKQDFMLPEQQEIDEMP